MPPKNKKISSGQLTRSEEFREEQENDHHQKMAKQLLHENAAEIIARVITAAQSGDMQAAKLVLDKIIPTKRDATVSINLPPIASAVDAAAAVAAVLASISDGSLTLSEADAMAKLIKNYIEILEVADIEKRLKAVETEITKHAAKKS